MWIVSLPLNSWFLKHFNNHKYCNISLRFYNTHFLTTNPIMEGINGQFTQQRSFVIQVKFVVYLRFEHSSTGFRLIFCSVQAKLLPLAKIERKVSLYEQFCKFHALKSCGIWKTCIIKVLCHSVARVMPNVAFQLWSDLHHFHYGTDNTNAQTLQFTWKSMRDAPRMRPLWNLSQRTQLLMELWSWGF